MRNFIALILLLLCTYVNAQSEGNIVTEDGKTYCIHKIKKGETLYSLSKTYDVKVKHIEKVNEGLTTNISLDQVIKIPCKNGRVPDIDKVEVADDSEIDEFKGNFIFHTITKGETVYSLTKKFNISEIQFYKDNEEANRVGLKLGSVVRILQVENTDEDHIVIERHFLNIVGNSKLNTFGADSNLLKDSTVFQLAVMFPFQYERNVKFLQDFEEDQQPKLYKETKTFVELYQGIKLAVDSIVKLGLNVQLFVYDTKADTNEIKKIIQKPEAKYFDLVIGPGYTSTFSFASKYFKASGIPMISPLSKNEKVIKDNPNTIKIVPSYEGHLEAIAKYVNENYLSENIIIAMQDDNDKKYAMKIERDILSQALMNDSLANLTISKVKGDYGVQPKLVVGKKNIVILANNKESFTSKLAVHLVNKSTSYKILIFGTEDLKKYKNIEVAYWDSLNIHVTGASNIAYGTPKVDQFISSYFNQFYTEPSRFAFNGYDFTFMLLKQVLETKKYSHSSVVGNYFMGGYRDYQFKYNGDQNGISNKAVSIFRLRDYKFIKVND
jgi:ABC-type branched-subunit amino acid transport system substrate-binding protein/LysM repeat protein